MFQTVFISNSDILKNPSGTLERICKILLFEISETMSLTSTIVTITMNNSQYLSSAYHVLGTVHVNLMISSVLGDRDY